MPWLELRINSTRAQAGQAEEDLLSAGALSVTLQDNADQAIFEPALGETPLWHETRVTGLFPAATDTQGIERSILGDYSSWQWQIVEDKDWQREWMQHYQPLRCAPNLWICPSWCEPPDPNATNLFLDPGLAFGTGTHPTTFMCLQWLAEQSLSEAEIIDYGCGSGILAVAALLLGAHHATGIDIDPQALLASRANAERNKLQEQTLDVHLAAQAPELEPVDVVLANILAGPLVELAPRITKLIKPKGLLCLSGILATQAEVVMAAYNSEIDFLPLRSQDEWVCLTGTRRG